jgi:hypothetical protein
MLNGPCWRYSRQQQKQECDSQVEDRSRCHERRAILVTCQRTFITRNPLAACEPLEK